MLATVDPKVAAGFAPDGRSPYTLAGDECPTPSKWTRTAKGNNDKAPACCPLVSLSVPSRKYHLSG